MHIETKFNNGDVVYSIQKEYQTDGWNVIGPLTIGKVSVSVTDSPGVDGEEVFSNFMPQKEHKETYMCIETGIGSGNIYYVERLFHDKESAKAEAESLNKAE